MLQQAPYRAQVALCRGHQVQILFTLLVQTSGGLIWAGSAAARLNALESRLEVSTGIGQRLARLEGQTSQMAQSLSRIERELISNE